MGRWVAEQRGHPISTTNTEGKSRPCCLETAQTANISDCKRHTPIEVFLAQVESPLTGNTRACVSFSPREQTEAALANSRASHGLASPSDSSRLSLRGLVVWGTLGGGALGSGPKGSMEVTRHV